MDVGDFIFVHYKNSYIKKQIKRIDNTNSLIMATDYTMWDFYSVYKVNGEFYVEK